MRYRITVEIEDPQECPGALCGMIERVVSHEILNGNGYGGCTLLRAETDVEEVRNPDRKLEKV